MIYLNHQFWEKKFKKYDGAGSKPVTTVWFKSDLEDDLQTCCAYNDLILVQ